MDANWLKICNEIDIDAIKLFDYLKEFAMIKKLKNDDNQIFEDWISHNYDSIVKANYQDFKKYVLDKIK